MFSYLHTQSTLPLSSDTPSNLPSNLKHHKPIPFPIYDLNPPIPMINSCRREIKDLMKIIFGTYTISKLNLKKSNPIDTFITPFCKLHNKNSSLQTFQHILLSKYPNQNLNYLFIYLSDKEEEEKATFELRDLLVTMKNRLDIFKDTENDLLSRERDFARFIVSLYRLTNENIIHELKFHGEIRSIDFYKENIHKFRHTYLSYIKKKQDLVERNIGSVFENPREAERVFMRPIIHLFGYIETFNLLKQNCFRSERSFGYLEENFKEILEMANRDMGDRNDKKDRECVKRDIVYNSGHKAKEYGKRDEEDRNNDIKKNEKFYKKDIDDRKDKDHLKRDKHMSNYKNNYETSQKSPSLTSTHKYTYKTTKSSPVHNLKLEKQKKYPDSQAETATYTDYFDPSDYKKDFDLPILPPFCATIEFGDLFFLTSFTSLHFSMFKKITIARIGQHFYPDKKIKARNIDTTHYEDYKYYVRYDGKVYILNNDADFLAGLIYSKGKIDILIQKDEEIDGSINS